MQWNGHITSHHLERSELVVDLRDAKCCKRVWKISDALRILLLYAKSVYEGFNLRWHLQKLEKKNKCEKKEQTLKEVWYDMIWDYKNKRINNNGKYREKWKKKEIKRVN